MSLSIVKGLASVGCVSAALAQGQAPPAQVGLSEPDPFLLWQHDPAAACPRGCTRSEGGGEFAAAA